MSVTAKQAKDAKRELPDGWRWVKLGEVCELYQPETISMQQMLAEPGPYPVFGANGVIGTFGKYNHEESEVLVTCRGATCGTVNFSQPRCWITGNAMVAGPRNTGKLDKQFLFWVLHGSDLSDAIAGAAQPQITRQSLSPIEIPLPPLPEQQRIAAVLREQMAAVDNARAAAQARMEAVKALPAAFLRQVFPQPGQPLPDGWRWVRLKAVVTVISGQHILESDYNRNGHGIGYLTGPADFGVTKPAITKWTEKPRVLCEPMDVLVTVKGAGVGKINLSPDVPVAIGRQLMAMRGHYGSIDTMFLFSFLITRFNYFQENAMGATVPGLSRKDLEMLVISLPPVAEQRRIADLLGEQMAAVEKARTAAEAGLTTINVLPAALLRRAFNGEI
jgi:type I restriction enzyme S subunit